MSLKITDLTVIQDNVTFLGGISTSFPRGRLTTILGRTLAGKTTLLRSLAGLQMPDRGHIELDAKSIDKLPVWQRDVAMVYQQFINYPHLTVFDNVAFPLRRKGVATGEIRSRVAAALERVGLSDFSERRPSQMSGGQQQRVALARALVRRSNVLLLDEPLANLDYKLREQLREDFRSLFADQQDAIIVYATTEPAEAMMLGDQVVVMHEGRVLQIGAPHEIYERPATVDVARIVDDPPMNIVPAVVRQGRLWLGTEFALPLPTHMGGLSDGVYKLGIRAQDVYLVSEGGVGASLAFSEISGSETFLYVDSAFGELAVQMAGIHDLTLGAGLRVGFAPERLLLFSADGKLLTGVPGGHHG
ncbi:ABC transporter ATP-binding protein [Ferrovibrio sp.]|uniref:ABC transporter ATP-binding protein n=1 Tax=Ferrovibrio sp. TaxID=1917215 RepID=UPI0035AE5847